MRVELVAFESLGVRSMATIVVTRDVSIFIDPSAALAPRRFGLPPHRIEAEKLLSVFSEIEDRLRDCDIVVITHYHYDHHDPGRFIDLSVFRGKKLIVKDFERKINFSQRMRAHRFLKMVKDLCREVVVGDGRVETVGKTKIVFSNPVPHGDSDKLGYVLEVCVDDGDERLLFSSDIEGAPLSQHLQPFYGCRPSVAIVDGPPTYLVGHRYGSEYLEASIRNLSKVLEMPWLETLILDHHSARELGFVDKLERLYAKSRELGKEILLASEYMGVETQLLEARRRELFEKEPVDGLRLLKHRGVEEVGDEKD